MRACLNCPAGFATVLRTLGIGLSIWVVSSVASAQDLEPRRWTHLPVGTHFVAAGGAFTDGELRFDPVLRIEDATVEMVSGALSYLRAFGLFGMSARADLLVPFQHGRWEGLLDGQPADLQRTGFADPRLRVSLNLFGAPALPAGDFPAYYANRAHHTTGGVALSIGFPVGHYLEDKLINLGQNRFVFRPQAGVVHTRGRFSYELTGSVFLYTENDAFFDGSTLAQDGIYALQAHFVYLHSARLWASAGVAYGWGGESTVDGEEKNDRKELTLTALSLGYGLTRRSRIGLTLGLGRTQVDTGLDSETVAISYLFTL